MYHSKHVKQAVRSLNIIVTQNFVKFGFPWPFPVGMYISSEACSSLVYCVHALRLILVYSYLTIPMNRRNCFERTILSRESVDTPDFLVHLKTNRMPIALINISDVMTVNT